MEPDQAFKRRQLNRMAGFLGLPQKGASDFYLGDREMAQSYEKVTKSFVAKHPKVSEGNKFTFGGPSLDIQFNIGNGIKSEDKKFYKGTHPIRAVKPFGSDWFGEM